MKKKKYKPLTLFYGVLTIYSTPWEFRGHLVPNLFYLQMIHRMVPNLFYPKMIHRIHQPFAKAGNFHCLASYCNCISGCVWLMCLAWINYKKKKKKNIYTCSSITLWIASLPFPCSCCLRSDLHISDLGRYYQLMGHIHPCVSSFFLAILLFFLRHKKSHIWSHLDHKWSVLLYIINWFIWEICLAKVTISQTVTWW